MIIPIEKLIPSKDVRKYIEEQKKDFTPEEEATLIYLSNSLDFENKLDFLKRISLYCESLDSKLSKEINRVVQQMNGEEIKLLREENNSFYTVTYYYPTYNTWDKYEEVFSTFEKAKEFVTSQFLEDEWLEESPTKIKIRKWYIDKKDGEWIQGEYNINFKLVDIQYSNIKDFEEFENKKDFTWNYVEIPHPFRRGDIVKNLVDGKIYIVTYPKDDVDYELDIERNKKFKEENKIDIFDMGLYLEGLKKDQFTESHALPSNLEFVDFENEPNYKGSKNSKTEVVTMFKVLDETKKDLLKETSSLLKGDGCLELFTQAYRDYLKSI